MTTERELLDSLTGTYTLAELYAAVEAAGPAMTERADGTDVIHGRTDTRWKRRLRGAIQAAKRDGKARRVGPSTWVIDGRPEAPRAAVLVSLDGRHGDVELRLERAADLLADLDEPADLILCDPPYALGVGRGEAHDTGARTYARNGSRVVGGYTDVDPSAYREFTAEWIAAAASAIRTGGHLAVVTGAQQAAWVQVAAEDAGLTYVNSIAVGKVFPLRTTRRFAHAHWTVTVMTRGRLDSDARVFTTPADLPRARSGVEYPQDLWPVGDVGRADAAPGELRYPNTLPTRLVGRLLEAFTRVPTEDRRDLVVDPFVGGGTVPVVAALRGLRVVAGDVNARALAFTAARVSKALTHGTVNARVRQAPGQLALC